MEWLDIKRIKGVKENKIEGRKKKLGGIKLWEGGGANFQKLRERRGEWKNGY